MCALGSKNGGSRRPDMRLARSDASMRQADERRRNLAQKPEIRRLRPLQRAGRTASTFCASSRSSRPWTATATNASSSATPTTSCGASITTNTLRSSRFSPDTALTSPHGSLFRPPAAPAAQAAPPTRSKHATGQEERSNARGHRHGPRVVRRGHAARGGCVGRSGGPVGEVNTDQVRGEGGRVDTDRRTNGSGSGVMTERREMCGRSGKGEIQR